MTMVCAGDIELSRLERRFASTRVHDAAALQRLVASIDACGQLIACIAVGVPEGATLVLIDGYRRVTALGKLGRDTARVECWGCAVSEALTQLLARSRSRPFAAIEEALLLRELMHGHGHPDEHPGAPGATLSLREVARRCGRDASWVQRRLQLLGALPDTVLQAVQDECVSSWAASRIFVPLARANAEHAQRLLASLQHGQALSTRELQRWFEQYGRAQRREREHMVEHPRLLIDSLDEREHEHAAEQLRRGPEREAVAEMGHLAALGARVQRRLANLHPPVASALALACRRLLATLPGLVNELQGELQRLSDDSTANPPQRVRPAAAGHEPARDKPAAGTVA
jgi:ParB-like chromosome segregation protein Spo0J